MHRERPVRKGRVELTRQCLAQRDHKEQQDLRAVQVLKVRVEQTQQCPVQREQ